MAFKLRLYPNWKAKQLLFKHFFGGMAYDEFAKIGRDFAEVIDGMIFKAQLEVLLKHIRCGDKVYVVSASVDEWVRPWCERNGVADVLATKIEVDAESRLTGRFLTKNCYGQEKVNRVLEMEPLREEYYLIAFGDSRGDKELLAFADEGKLIK